jgi:hypothetical protein
MASTVSLSFPDSTYSSSNKPSADTLKTDLSAIETALNANAASMIEKDGSTEVSGNIVSTATPTAATHLATMGAVYPIGSVYLAVVSTNPATLLGFGTWSRIAEGQMLVGYKSGDADFGTVEGTGGAKTVSIAHTHTGPSHTHTGPSHTHSVLDMATANYDYYGGVASNTGQPEGRDYLVAGHNHPDTGAAGTSDTGAGGTGNTGAMSANATPSIINPFFTIYAWKRVS